MKQVIQADQTARLTPVRLLAPLPARRPGKFLTFWPALAITVLTGTGWLEPASANDTAGVPDGHETHAPHAHGSGTLNVALDGPTLVVELLVPADHLVGFEHAPATPAQHAAVDEALAAGRKAGNWLHPDPAAGCVVQGADVHLGGQDSAAHVDSHPTREAGQHSDYEAVYTFDCTQPDMLSSIRFSGFARLHGMERLTARFITPRGQGAQTLSAAQPVLQLSQ